jgi:hypothetical protein
VLKFKCKTPVPKGYLLVGALIVTIFTMSVNLLIPQKLKVVCYCKNRKEKLYKSNAYVTWVYIFVLKLPEGGITMPKHEGG